MVSIRNVIQKFGGLAQKMTSSTSLTRNSFAVPAFWDAATPLWDRKRAITHQCCLMISQDVRKASF